MRPFILSRIESSTLMALALTSLFFGLASSPQANAARQTSEAEFENIFTNGPIIHVQIKITEKDMAILRKSRWEWGGGQEKRATVQATVREGDRLYTNVAIHLKGAAGSFRPVDDTPGLTLNFGKHARGQTFHGLQRISLNNSVQDPTYLSEQICRELFAAADVPVPRATEATVELNGRDLGIYVLAEAFNKQFLARHFKNTDGNLYDGGFLKDVSDDLEKSSGKNPQDRADLKKLADAARDPNPTNRFTRLNQVLDLNRFITLLALDVMLCNWDGYAINKNNYRIYHDPDSDKITFMPHGLDQMFGVMRTGPNMPIFPRMNGLAAIAVLQTPQGREQFRQRIVDLMAQVYKVEALSNRVQVLAARIRPTLAKTKPGAATSYDREVQALCERIAQRWQSIREQLAAADATLTFGSDGVARLADWKPRTEFGKPVLDETVEAGGKKMLHIGATNGSCVGSWSTKVRLGPGRYRFEGKIKCRGVLADPGDRKGGAGLRTADRRAAQKLSGDTGWTDVVFEFDLTEAQREFGFMGKIESVTPEVELLCELRAAKGEAWFDRESLRLLRK